MFNARTRTDEPCCTWIKVKLWTSFRSRANKLRLRTPASQIIIHGCGNRGIPQRIPLERVHRKTRHRYQSLPPTCQRVLRVLRLLEKVPRPLHPFRAARTATNKMGISMSKRNTAFTSKVRSILANHPHLQGEEVGGPLGKWNPTRATFNIPNESVLPEGYGSTSDTAGIPSPQKANDAVLAWRARDNRKGERLSKRFILP